jgi:hypothetical protein
MTEPHVPTEAVFRHVDDIAWTPVQRQRNADGSESCIREKWPIIRPDFLSAYAHYEPGLVCRRHGHRSNHVFVVLEGGAWIGGKWCAPGTHIHVPLGATFGPIVGGPEGVTCWELSFGEFGGWGDEPERFEREIKTRGVTPLPNPPIELGAWFKDPRDDVGAVRPVPRVHGLSEVVTRFDGFPWRELRRQRNADGSESGVRAKIAIDTPHFVSALVEYDPGMVTRRERWGGMRVVFVYAGGAWIGGIWRGAGTHIEVPAGAPVGPIVAGPKGVTFLEMTDADVRSEGVDRGAFETVLAANKVTPLADPPVKLGFEDTRGVWA